MTHSVLTVEIRFEHDIVLARQRARQIAELLRFDRQDQVRIATAVSELARNAFQYAQAGKVEFQIVQDDAQSLQIRIADNGPGIANLTSILDGQYVSQTGMGLGLVGARRLMDSFQIASKPGKGTVVVIGKRVPVSETITPQTIACIGEQLARQTPQNPFEEIQRQNQELLSALDELQTRQKELSQANRELEETNRGVVALYAELDEKAESVRRVSEVKSRFLSNVTHEFRTPLNSITSLTRMLLGREDGELSNEQERQVTYIRHAAENLIEMVNDLLDLAKVESGKSIVRPAELEIPQLFSTLRGMLRPLIDPSSKVNLIFEEPSSFPVLITDETKLSQILRNFISNALKYTAQGEIRIRATMPAPGMVTFSVADTGIGIAPEHQAMIFEEFVQVEGPHQKRIKGTGLGLPLSKKLAEMLGGWITLESRPGSGSTFAVTLPVVFDSSRKSSVESAPPRAPDHRAARSHLPEILIIDDDEEARYACRNDLSGDHVHCLEARDGVEGIEIARRVRPAAIFLDLAMRDLDGFAVLEQLRADAQTSRIPVIIHTSRNLTEIERKQLESLSTTILKKTHTRSELTAALRAAGVETADQESYAGNRT